MDDDPIDDSTHPRSVVAAPPADDRAADEQLLKRFLTRRDEAAFEALVRRHGPMVLGVCRRVVRDPEDVEDAFQTAFLVLVRKAAAVRRPERLANWLYGVAYRSALEARAARRRARERTVSVMPEPPAPAEATWDDVRAVLDEELVRLPEKYRLPVVLCDLEGRTRRDVADHLGIPVGTLSGRLTTAHRRLARRLTSRGVVLPAGGLAALLIGNAASAAVPGPLVALTVRGVAGGATSARVASLADGVTRSLFRAKLKAATGAALLIAAFVVGGGWALRALTLPSASPDGDRLQGRWVLVYESTLDTATGAMRRRTTADLADRSATATFTGDRVTLRDKGVTRAGTYRLDATRDPRWVDLFVTDAGPVAGIYAFRGEELILSLPAGAGDGRPTEPGPAKGVVRQVYRRD